MRRSRLQIYLARIYKDAFIVVLGSLNGETYSLTPIFHENIERYIQWKLLQKSLFT